MTTDEQIGNMVRRYQELIARIACLRDSLGSSAKDLRQFSGALNGEVNFDPGRLNIGEEDRITFRLSEPYQQKDVVQIPLTMLADAHVAIAALQSRVEKVEMESCLRQAGLDQIIRSEDRG